MPKVSMLWDLEGDRGLEDELNRYQTKPHESELDSFGFRRSPILRNQYRCWNNTA